MGRPRSHEAIIRAAAKAHLAPLGFKQKGRSRIWLRDHVWWLAIVDFQPSSWSKGSYLNVACMWLWHPQDDIAFHVSERLGRYAEFVDEASFRPTVDDLARVAAEESLKNEQQFQSLQAVLSYLETRLVGSQNHWDYYNAMMAALGCGQIDRAAKLFQSLQRLAATYEWCVSLQERAAHVMTVARGNMASAVEEQVALARERLALPPNQVFPRVAPDA
jgi:hypothetical protein